MNPYALLGAGVLFILSMFGAYQFGHSTATTAAEARCAKAVKVVADQAIVARDQADAEKKTLQDYANLLGKMYTTARAKSVAADLKLAERTQLHVEQNPIATDHRCDLPADLLRDVNDAGGNSEGREGEPGGVGTPEVPVAAADPV
jgi:hypothetical protein